MSEKKILVDVQELRTYFPIQGGVVRKTIGHVHAVEDVSFQIREQETFGLVGESGCGKSTTGRTLLRLIQPTAGRVLFDGVDLSALSKEEMRKKRRDMQLVFQDPYASLNPRMTVRRLLEEPLVTHFTLTQGELEEKVSWIAQAVGLAPEQLERYPHQFSGGQRQRVAMGRAIVRNPKVFLFDEPLSNLDAKLRGSMRREIMLLHKKLNATMMYVTHDQTEALTLADRIVCMSMGHVQQIGKPIDLYEHPANTFVATFIGLPPMNMFEGKIEGGKFVSELFEYPLTAEQTSLLADYEGKEVILGVRPENIVRGGCVDFVITNNENLGMNTLVHGKIGGKKIVVCKFAEWCNYKYGDEIKLGFDPERMHFFDKETANAIR